MIKIQILILIVTLSGIILVPAQLFAQNTLLGPVCDRDDFPADAELCADDNRDITGDGGILTSVLNTLLFFAAIISVISIITASLRYVTSSGNPQTVTAARNQLIWSLGGLAIAFAAFAIYNFVIDALLN